MILKSIVTGVAALLLAGSVHAPAQAQWQPEKPLRIIVPWGAGGSTDQVVRLLAADIEDALGQTVVVVNQPGGAGAVGTKAALDADHDGYTWTAGAAKDLGTYGVTGAIDTHLKDWNLYLALVNFTVMSANPDSKFKSVEDVVAAMKDDPDSVTIATGGINSASGAAAEALKAATGGEYKMVTYDGGNPAVMATVAGESQITTQLISEQFEMLRAKKLTPLAAFTNEAVTLEGIGTIPSIKDAVPDAKVGPVYFGIWIPKDGTPEDVIATMDQIWDDKIANSQKLKEYADSKGLSLNVKHGEEAYEQAFPSTQINAWQIHDGGKSKVSPDTIGIPRP
ncbi:tripartite tricarboxylate transporter substrate binding protein [Microbaculum marinum]|uniref:Tripartite tricarboxylate transporter substrate binding protein n=1 Tax=Microbaculum marinum TaxID=1764581 RepID=A0AAW9RQN3_9HYPH